MPMNITEKIFAAHAGLDEVKAGDLISAKVDSGVYGIVDCDYILRDLNIFVNDYID